MLADTSGWPLGVALAAQGDPRRHGPTRELVDEYFEEEVLAALGPQLRAEVIAASIAPDLEIAAAAGIGLSQDIAPEHHGLFLRGGAPAAFHPLFADALRARFEREVPATDRRAAHARVAAALEAQRPWRRGGRRSGWPRRTGRPRPARSPARAARWRAPRRRRCRPGSTRCPPSESAQPALRLLAGALAHGAGRLDEAVDLCREASAASTRPVRPR